MPGPWWKEFQKNLGLSDDQSARIEAVFQAALPYLRHKRDELEAQETELSRLIKADADEVVIGKQSDRVEAIRAALNKSRTLMLVHMRQMLTPDQRIKLNALREQWDKDHPPPSRGDRNGPRAPTKLDWESSNVHRAITTLHRGTVMTRNRSMCHAILGTLLTAAIAAPASAQQISEARIQELVRQAAERVAAGQTGQAPTITGGARRQPRPTVRMTLDDAVKAALDHNLNIAVQRLNPEINDISISSLQSVYRPSLTSVLSTQSQSNPSTTTIAGGAACRRGHRHRPDHSGTDRSARASRGSAARSSPP